MGLRLNHSVVLRFTAVRKAEMGDCGDLVLI